MEIDPQSKPRPGPEPTGSLSYEEEPSPNPSRAAGVPAKLARGTSVQHFVILERVGEGGMGIVYSAYDPSLDRRVALKFLAPHAGDRENVREKRLLREAQAMARLSHPNVAAAYAVGMLHGHVFLAMEFVDGVDLRTWVAQEKRPFSQILDVFLAAGRGLAAAHEAGIVHRDFKPENVLVDKQGRPRVTDFGLSRAARDPDDDEPEPAAADPATETSPLAHLVLPLTRTGGVLGTPPYMPPEQRAGRAVDARSDQFAFCVALYEALHGERPFDDTPSGKPGSGPSGTSPPAPFRSSIPKWCRRALQRGLASAPEDRFPNMEALLAALSPRPKRRRQFAIAVSVGVVLVAGATYALTSSRAAESPGRRCDLGAKHLAGTWDAARKDRLHAAFRQSGARDADFTWKGFAALVDQWSVQWATAHNAACSATHIAGTQSPAVLDLRMECLDRKRQDLNALVEVYSGTPDRKSLDRAIAAADSLPSISACADVANLRTLIPLPDSPEARGRVESLRTRLSRSHALHEAGRYPEGLEYTEPLKQEAEAVGYAPLTAEAHHALARHLARAGKAEEAEKILLAALDHAVRGRHVGLEAHIWTELIATYPRDRPIPEARLTAKVAGLAIARANGDALMFARLANNIGVAEERAANWEEAVRQFQLAVDQYKKSLKTQSPEYAAALAHLGSTLSDLGRHRQALDYLEPALTLQRTILRPDHPDMASSLWQLSRVYVDLGRFHKARDAAQSSYAIRAVELGPDHAGVTYSLSQVAQAEAWLGNTDRAMEILAQVLSIRQRARGGHASYVGSVYLLLGEAQRLAGDYRRAEAALTRAWQLTAGSVSAPGTPWLAYPLTQLGLVHNRLGHHGKALQECRRATEIFKESLGQDTGWLLETTECLAEALIEAGRFDAARQELQHVLTPAAEANFGPRFIAGPRFQLARALWATPAERPRARQLARAALQALTTAEGDHRELISRIETWLSEHDQSYTVLRAR